MVGKQESSTRALRTHKSWVQRLDTAIANITPEKSLEVWLPNLNPLSPFIITY